MDPHSRPVPAGSRPRPCSRIDPRPWLMTLIVRLRGLIMSLRVARRFRMHTRSFDCDGEMQCRKAVLFSFRDREFANFDIIRREDVVSLNL